MTENAQIALITALPVIVGAVANAWLTIRNGKKTEAVHAEVQTNTAITKDTHSAVVAGSQAAAVRDATEPKEVLVVNPQPIPVVER